MRIILLMLLWTNSVFSRDLIFSDYEKKIKSTYSIKNVVEKISKDNLESILRDFLAKSRPSRVMGSTGHLASEKLIEENLKALKSNGTSVVLHEFTPDVVFAGKMYEDDFNREILPKYSANDPVYKHWKDFTVSMIKALAEIKNIKGKNYYWEKKGTTQPQEVIVIGANYDTINHDQKTMKVDLKSNMPGADNNGTGVAMLLAMARIFNNLDMPKTIRIVFLDAEEFGFLGSKAFVEEMKKNASEKIVGFINLTMLGNDTKVKDSEKKLNNMKVYLRDPNLNKEEANKDLEFVSPLLKMGTMMYPIIEFSPLANNMNSSSHIRFWEAGIPAVCFSQNWETDLNPRTHTSDDFVETINMTTFLNSFRYITSSVIAFNFGIVK